MKKKVFPALAAFTALDSPATEANKEDLAHWLTYFVIFATLTTIEYFQNVLLYDKSPCLIVH